MNRRTNPLPAAGSAGPWDLLVALVATGAAIAAPSYWVGGIQLVSSDKLYEWIFTIVFLADLVFRVITKGRKRSRTDVFLLAADLIAAVPFLAVAGVPALAVLRLLKLPRVAELMRQWRYLHLRLWNSLRLAYFVYWLALFAHWLTLGWLVVKYLPGQGNAAGNYLQALYWCLSTLTTIGYAERVAVTDPEILYSILVMIFGVATYGYVIASAANILVNMDPARSGYLNHMEKLSSLMNYRGIPAELQRRVREYHSYVWSHRLGYDEEEILAGLPPTLMTEVSIYLKRDVIQHVPFFATASDQLIREIALQMHPEVYMPGDAIVTKGETGRAMFFISRGEVAVLEDDGRTRAVLRKGDAFGEMALVLKRPRTATVKAVGYCDLYRLDKAAFDDILLRYPDFAAHFRSLARQRRDHKRTA